MTIQTGNGVCLFGQLALYTEQLHSMSVNHSPNPNHNPTNPNPTPTSLPRVRGYFSPSTLRHAHAHSLLTCPWPTWGYVCSETNKVTH